MAEASGEAVQLKERAERALAQEHLEALFEDAYRFPKVWEPAPVRDRVFVPPFDLQSALLRRFI